MARMLTEQQARAQVSRDRFPDDSPHSTTLGVSPDSGTVPLWVVACALFAPPEVNAADKVITAATVLMASTVRVHGDLAVKLSPLRLALLCGFERPEKAKWLTDYLQEIGFLKVVDGGINPKTGRRQARRDAKGRPIDNEFLVLPVPPTNYCGPRTLAEIDALIAEDIAAAELEHERRNPGSKKRSRPRNIPIQRRDLFDVSAGQSTLPPGGTDSATQPPARGDGDVSAGQPTLPPGGTYQIDRSSISEREIEGSIEPVPGGTAKPPATGLEESAVAAVREQVRRLPWRKWAKVKLGVTNYQLMRHDADQVQNAMCAAMARDGITLEQATEVARHALAEAKGPVYVVRAFEPKKLGEWLRRLEAEPLAEDALPLPGAAKSQFSDPKPAKQQGSAAADPDDGEPSKPVLPACSTCDAEEGETYPNARTVTGADGREQRCPDCLPPAAA